jgi:hypothetical protein
VKLEFEGRVQGIRRAHNVKVGLQEGYQLSSRLKHYDSSP